MSNVLDPVNAAKEEEGHFSNIFNKNDWRRFLGRPCNKDSLIYGICSGMGVYLGIFGFTSNIKRAARYGMVSLFTVTAVYAIGCPIYMKSHETPKFDFPKVLREQRQAIEATAWYNVEDLPEDEEEAKSKIETKKD